MATNTNLLFKLKNHKMKNKTIKDGIFCLDKILRILSKWTLSCVRINILCIIGKPSMSAHSLSMMRHRLTSLVLCQLTVRTAPVVLGPPYNLLPVLKDLPPMGVQQVEVAMDQVTHAPAPQMNLATILLVTHGTAQKRNHS
uniref:Uncharacterized protein n=1 Tax=Cacopsylla melanoneura TaxID=428564 RepID=A0A8D9BW60_9HEMI